MTRDWTKAAVAALFLLTSSFALAADEKPDATLEFSGDRPLSESAPNGVTAPCTIRGRLTRSTSAALASWTSAAARSKQTARSIIWRRWRTSLATTPRRRLGRS